MSYQPKTGQRCDCKPGLQRDNCPACEGTYGLRSTASAALRATRSNTQRRPELDRVILKSCPNGQKEAIAFLPDAPANPGNVLSYQHLGQHGEASYAFYLACRPLSPRTKEGAALLRELRAVGYRPRLVRRIQHKKGAQ